MALLRWDNDAPPRVEIHTIDEPGIETLIANPTTQATPPVANSSWVAWLTGRQQNQLWVVPTDDLLHGGFLAVSERSALNTLQLVGDSLFFIDSSTDTLQRFELTTGRREVLAEGPFSNRQVSAQPDAVVWVHAGEPGSQVRVLNRGDSPSE